MLLEAYKAGRTPEQIAEEFDVIQLQDVYATITYHLRHKERLDVWLREVEDKFNRAVEESRNNPSPPAERLRQVWEDDQGIVERI